MKRQRMWYSFDVAFALVIAALIGVAVGYAWGVKTERERWHERIQFEPIRMRRASPTLCREGGVRWRRFCSKSWSSVPSAEPVRAER